MTLTEFLLARIAEDEHWWRVVEERESSADVPTTNWLGKRMTTRMLAECEAKRRIVQMEESYEDAYVTAVRALAAVYADHPDYDESWRP